MTTPQDASPLQGAGERKNYSLTGVDAGDGLLRVFVDHGCRHPSPPIVVIPMPEPSKDLERAARRHLAPRQPSNAERQAWEEERRELNKRAFDAENALEEQEAEHAAALASLREENARLEQRVKKGDLDFESLAERMAGEREGADLEQEAWKAALAQRKADNSRLAEESARLRARVEELEGVLEFYAADYNWTEEPDGGEPPTGAHDPGSPPDGYLEPKALRDAGSQARAALSSLGEQERGEVAP